MKPSKLINLALSGAILVATAVIAINGLVLIITTNLGEATKLQLINMAFTVASLIVFGIHLLLFKLPDIIKQADEEWEQSNKRE